MDAPYTLKIIVNLRIEAGAELETRSLERGLNG